MQISVLERVERRRRRRRRGPLLLLLLACVLGFGGFQAARELRTSRVARAQPARHETPRPHRKSHSVPTPPRLAGPPLPLISGRRPVSERAFHPSLTSASAILVDARTGRVLWAHRPHRRRLIASTTKIMTAVLALERLRLGTRITIAR